MHPLKPCAIRHLCCCLVDPEVTCYILGIIILVSAFAGVTNVGAGSVLFIILSVVNFMIHFGAALVLILGTVWCDRYMKVGFCWLICLALIFEIVCYASNIVIYGSISRLKVTSECADGLTFAGFIQLTAHLVWLVFWDIYSTLVVLGNLDVCCDEDISYACVYGH